MLDVASLSRLTEPLAVDYLERLRRPLPALSPEMGVQIVGRSYLAHLAVEEDPEAYLAEDVPVLGTLPPARQRICTERPVEPGGQGEPPIVRDRLRGLGEGLGRFRARSHDEGTPDAERHRGACRDRRGGRSGSIRVGAQAGGRPLRDAAGAAAGPSNPSPTQGMRRESPGRQGSGATARTAGRPRISPQRSAPIRRLSTRGPPGPLHQARGRARMYAAATRGVAARSRRRHGENLRPSHSNARGAGGESPVARASAVLEKTS